MIMRIFFAALTVWMFFSVGCTTMQEKQSIHFGVVDRITDDSVLMLIGTGEAQINMPLAYIPEGTSEGDWLVITIGSDSQKTEAQRERIAGMLESIRSTNK